MGGHPAQGGADRRAGRRAAGPRSRRCSTSRSRRGRPSRGGSPTGWSRCRSGRCASAGSRRSTTAPRWWWSTSRPSTRCRSTTCSPRCPTSPSSSADRGGFDTDDASYGKVVDQIIRDEIGQGEGANLVIGRHYRAVVADWDADRALTVYPAAARARARRLLDVLLLHRRPLPDRREPGAPRQRPRRRRPDEPDLRHLPGRAATATRVKDRLLDFLADEKEIYELFMVVDEELKMMCDICHEGGQVLGPFLKPMTHLIHTEYLLAGRSDRDPREILRDTMYAATVTGSPVENACRLIASYEPEGRGYYGAALALFGRDRRGPADGGQPDPDPHRRRRRRRPAQGVGRRHAGARLRGGVRGGRDARQGERHPQCLRAGAAGAGPRARRRRRSPATRTC